MKKLIAFILAASVLVISVCAAPAVDDPVEVEVIESVTDQVDSKALSLSDPGIMLLDESGDDVVAKLNTLINWAQSNNQTLNAVMTYLYSTFTLPDNYYLLWADGTLHLTANDMSFWDWIRNQFSGLATILRGNALFDSKYSVNILGNDNQLQQTTQHGIGPMVNAWLDAIEKNSGNLAFMFASPEDVAAKGDSSTNLGAATDEMLSPDADASVKVSDIKSVSSISSGLKKYGDTGVSIGDMFDSLGDDSVFSFFTQETADNLDSTITTFSRDPRTQIVTNYYEQSREEFNSRVGKDGE